MKSQLSLIIVAGPNASGKTTLVERNQDYLTANNFDIILPDKIFKFATSLTDRPAVIDEFIENAITAQKNIIIETPFQNQPFISRIQEIKKKGYETSLYQVYLSNIKESIKRVEFRFQKGGMYIGDQQVAENYAANFKSISNVFHKFNHAYFLDNAMGKDFTLTAQFQSGKLEKLKATDSTYLKEFFKACYSNKTISASDLKIIAANQDYNNSAQQVNKPRLKFWS